MHAPTIVSVLALAAAAVNAVPNAGIADDGVVEKRQNPVIQLFDARCYENRIFQSTVKGMCRNLAPNLRDRAASGKAGKGFRCTVFRNLNCQGPMYDFVGGDPKFCKLKDSAKSWKCVLD
ncbi:hypothetical protein B0J13DRAFT_242105 [Dactylonectria estremocensis]|uniref:Uncharacterized protein n=1 Tax=Dactylonectria estremocensis TaxID=1079267 RepID=A0A9P9D6U2_9HYPO|nr:hypothetical protein B0J13DRAFT_242105 [Dactylonectria estremocensis]